MLVIGPHARQEVGDKLLAQREKHLPRFSKLFHRSKCGVPVPLRRHQPSRQLGGKGRLAFAARSLHYDIPFPRQHPLRLEQVAAPPQKTVRRLLGQIAQREFPSLLNDRRYLLARHFAHQLRVLLLLEKHGHEPILEVQLAGERLVAEGVGFEGALSGQHGLADPFPLKQIAVKL